jgi:hypothetical protein
MRATHDILLQNLPPELIPGVPALALCTFTLYDPGMRI